MQKEKQYKKFKQIVNIFYNEELEILDDDDKEISQKEKGSVDIEPTIIFDKFTGNMKVEFKIGKSRKFKIKDIAEFYDRMQNKEFYRYGEKTRFTHRREAFNEKSQKLLDFILKYAETMKISNLNNGNNYNYYTGSNLDASRIIIGNSGIDELFEILKGETVKFTTDGKSEGVEFVDENPQIEFILSKNNENEYILKPNIEIFKIRIIRGKKYKYILKRERLYRCTEEFENTNLKLLQVFREQYITEVEFGEKDLKDLFSIVMPKVKNAIKIQDISQEQLEEYKPEELITKVYLDFDEKGYLVAELKFCYGMKEFNPLDETTKQEFPRNIIKETKHLNIFKKTGFMFDAKNLRFVLPEDKKIYKFLTKEIQTYTQNFQVNVTENFKTKQIKQPKIGSVGVRIESDLLSITIEDLNIDPKEIEKILKKYKEKEKYYRLKTGEFIDIQNSKEISFIEKLVTGMEIEAKQLENGTVTVPVHRALYLNELLKQIKETPVTKNEEFKKLVRNIDKENIEEMAIPSILENTLRYYQKTGFKWLKVLDNYKFGGILADDMGLGKTIQILSIIVDYIESFEKNPDIIEGQEELIPQKRKTSLVISPSSLTLNWQNEAKKFTTNLKTLVIRGNAEERKNLLSKIDDYDLVITSYDLLKRDIELYKEKDYKFRYIIADEAQYLKNSNTQNAKSIKEIKADTRYALTGTPIENSLSELWSIFDFIMPGYLFDYKKFKTYYEMPIVRDDNPKAIEKLKALISPFVLRRTKQEVLTELPEKSITILTSEMKEDQEQLYISYLAQAKQEIARELKIDEKAFKNNQMKILAALTRLRQICCHPSLFIKDYKDGSSKLDQCMEIITDAIKGGHKILLFSSYTSMFEILEKELKEKDITYFKLTGSTKVEERVELVDEFNENKNVKLFLISLKAGGTGLNLTGADIVIHYDPWWNLSAENQATDRAYRIGQKNNVQVYKLITKNTIEEKIYEIQQRKADLIDNMLNTETVFANKLSKEEILSLFDQ